MAKNGVGAAIVFPLALAFVAGLLFASPGKAGESSAAIAAAASLQFALTDIQSEFARTSGEHVRVSYGSSGNLVRQIANGAPFELFLSADAAHTQRLYRDGFADDAGVRFADGRLVFFTPNGSRLKADSRFADLRAAIRDGRLKKFTIANPEHAPYGRAAREALIAGGLWDALQPFLVFGENAAQTARFAASGSTEGGIIPYALAVAPSLTSRGQYTELPASLHAPLQQTMVLLKHAGKTARHFYAYLQGPEAHTVFARYGFAPPRTAH